MDFETRKIYKALESFGKVDGISDIIRDMDALNEKIGEYKNMYRLNAYNVPSLIPDIESTKNEIESKYNSYFQNLRDTHSNYNINVFGVGADCFERQLEMSLSKLGKVAIMKVCDHLNVECKPEDLSGSTAEAVQYFKTALSKADSNIIETKVNFKVSF